MAWALASTPLLGAVLLLGIAMRPTAGMAGTAEVLRKVGICVSKACSSH